MTIKESFLKSQMLNRFMKSGNKSLSEGTFLKCYKFLQKQTTKNHKLLTKLSIINTASIIQTKQIKKKKRKTIKEFPFVVNRKNRITLSIKSILESIKKKLGSKAVNQLVSELLLTSQNKAEFLVLKKARYREALLKKKYASFRWFC